MTVVDILTKGVDKISLLWYRIIECDRQFYMISQTLLGGQITHLVRGKVATEKSKRITIAISQQTKDALDSVKHPGQTYDGVIQELVKFWEDKEQRLSKTLLMVH